jgi:hypothetical protein
MRLFVCNPSPSMRSITLGWRVADIYDMGEKIKQFLSDAGSILDLCPPSPDVSDLDAIIDSRPKTAAEALREDMLRVEHDFRRAFNRIRAEADGKADPESGETE